MSTAAGPQLFLPHSGQWVPARRLLFIEGARQRSLAHWMRQLKRKAAARRVGMQAAVKMKERKEVGA